MLPRRCKKCRCYVAPQLMRCPRCNKSAPSLNGAKPTKEDKAAERSKRDADLPIIKAIHMQWAPSTVAIASHEQTEKDVRRQLAHATTARMRNSLRSELREIKRVLSKATGLNPKRRWSKEIFHTKHSSVPVFISPKGRRYVLSSTEGPADLLIQPRKKDRGLPMMRLLKFDRSPLARMAKLAKKEEAVHKKRKHAKKLRRAKKRTVRKERE